MVDFEFMNSDSLSVRIFIGLPNVYLIFSSKMTAISHDRAFRGTDMTIEVSK